MKPGDKVICVDASIDAEKAEEIRRDFEIWVTKDKEYTIREILDNNGIVPGLLLEDIHNFPKYFSTQILSMNCTKHTTLQLFSK